MTAHEVRCHALEMLGYTPRQAQFLVLIDGSITRQARVALQGGYFLRRQYVTFTGTPHGQATVRFLAHAVGREHVRVLPYGRQGHVFHLLPARCMPRSEKRTIATVVELSGMLSCASSWPWTSRSRAGPFDF